MVRPHVLSSMFFVALVSCEDLDPGCALDDDGCDSFSGTAALQIKSSNLNERLVMKEKNSTPPDLLFNRINVFCTKRRDGELNNGCNIGELKLYGGGGKITDNGIKITPHLMGTPRCCSGTKDSDKAFDGTGKPVCMSPNNQNEPFHDFKVYLSPPTPLDGFKYKTGKHSGYKKKDMVRWEIYGRMGDHHNEYLLSKQTSDYPIPDKLNTWGDKIPMWFLKDVSGGKCMREIKCKLDFSQASVEYNETAMSLKIVYENICFSTDLVIKSTTPYGPDTVEKATANSGYINGYGQIHMDANHSTTFSFDFVRKHHNPKFDGLPEYVHSSVLSFLDVDQNDDGSVSEEISIKGVGSHYVNGVDVLTDDVDGTLKFRGTKAAEPMDYTSAASIALLDVSHFDLTFSNVGMAVGGRNLMMTGATPLFTEC